MASFLEHDICEYFASKQNPCSQIISFTENKLGLKLNLVIIVVFYYFWQALLHISLYSYFDFNSPKQKRF